MMLDELYRDLHANPELSFAEHRTAAIVAERMRDAGLEVQTGIAGTGVVAVLVNGEGPCVLLRADMDALPVLENTGLPYASQARGVDPDGLDVPVMHACGHDMHTTCLVGAVEQLAREQSEWSGTLVAVFQPAEEREGGAQAMIADGLFDRIHRPDVVLGQHLNPLPAGTLGVHPGAFMAAVDTLHVTLFGRGGHGSRPQKTIDPVLMAAAVVMRLQGVVAREVAPLDTAVVTVGSLHAGTKNNIIPGEARLGLSLRSFSPVVRDRMAAAVRRIIRAESDASGATREPEFRTAETYPVTVNDADASARVVRALRGVVASDRVIDPGVLMGSEDVGILAAAVGAPLVYWLLGCVDPDQYHAAEAAGRLDEDIPSNHSDAFAPVIEPTLSIGVQALRAAALEWLAR
ncbi:amidohydrolase [Rathayibacter sp. YIM 133350]|uniref:amidohydrolase n=1 Tax=Rathayibacter sp. YIM 133350 TaxID=3131992 RepID=UPI00307F40B7